ncbi:pyridoxal 5'-phosphate synthase [Aureococcus anophagefferens]|nr:pyridoxal 5'-phosphate synthase [Aureococcus anophagefferens]
MDALGDALCGCGDDAVELDERDDLPPTLSAYVINAMQAPTSARKQEDFRRKAPAEIGRPRAALHRAAPVPGPALGAYSPALLEGLLRVDVDRVWREEPRVARSLDPPRPTDPSDVLYLVDEEWLRAWRSWAFYAPPRGGDADPPPPPGPLSNARLAAPPRPPLAPYALGVDYRAVSPSLYAYFSLCHGAADEPGLAAARTEPPGARRSGLAIAPAVDGGLPVYGTCAGLVLLADRAIGQRDGGQPLIGGLDCDCCRNYFGAQVSSFEVRWRRRRRRPEAALVAKDYPAVFIRAPAILKVGKKCEALASVTVAPHASAAPAVKAFDGPAKPPKKKAKKQAAAEAAIPEREVVVAARQGNILVTAFHPELTDDTRWHDVFLAMVKKRTSG